MWHRSCWACYRLRSHGCFIYSISMADNETGHLPIGWSQNLLFKVLDPKVWWHHLFIMALHEKPFRNWLCWLLNINLSSRVVHYDVDRSLSSACCLTEMLHHMRPNNHVIAARVIHQSLNRCLECQMSVLASVGKLDIFCNTFQFTIKFREGQTHWAKSWSADELLMRWKITRELPWEELWPHLWALKVRRHKRTK